MLELLQKMYAFLGACSDREDMPEDLQAAASELEELVEKACDLLISTGGE